jgi:predicted ribosomally synthesized peptide with SipW-like signal peptide
MKKVGLLILALVIALGALGVGYAKWTDTVMINGSVQSGSILLGINDRGTNDPLGTFDKQCAPGRNPERKDVGSMVSTNVGDSLFTLDEIQFYKSIDETFTNVYPWYSARTVIRVANGGTVPVKIENIIFSGLNSSLENWMTFSWIITDENGITHPGSGCIGSLISSVNYIQIRGGSYITIDLTTCFIEESFGGLDPDTGEPIMVKLPQGVTATYNVQIIGSQWNEVREVD